MRKILYIFVTLVLLSSCTSQQNRVNKTSLESGQQQEEQALAELEEEGEISVSTLRQKLNDYAELSRQKLPQSVKEQMIVALQELQNSSLEAKFLKLGDKAPNFRLKSVEGAEIELYKLLEHGPVVLVFYRGGWCPYCSLELREFNQYIDQFREEKASLVAVSPELPNYAAVLKSSATLDFPLLYDKKNKVAKKYNLVFKLPKNLKPIYKDMGLDIEVRNGEGSWKLPVPATYIIGSDGLIKYAFADVDYKNRSEPTEVLRQLRLL